MKGVDLPLRKAYVLALSNLTYKGVKIPVYEEKATPTTNRPFANIPYGNTTVQAYIVLLNQTSNDNSSKCIRNDQASIQVQITTVWPQDKGGSLMAEEISDLVTAELFDESGLFNLMVLPTPFEIWKGVLEGARNMPYETETNSVWVRQLILNNWITQ